MNEIDGLLLLLLAIADMALFAYLRRRRRRVATLERMTVSLQLHLRRTGSDRNYGVAQPLAF